ncbi:MAG: hypothetical protein JXN61_00880 [Sedimentisphaerales bacterium]|nr:hypothetical protein [Sedimentisphaerales bacterium]
MFRDLAAALKNNDDLHTVQGLVFRDNAHFVHTPKRPYIENLDELPFVSRVYNKFLKIENYFNPNALYPMVTIITSRGCQFQCTFCVYRHKPGHYRYRPAKRSLRSRDNTARRCGPDQRENPADELRLGV